MSKYKIEIELSELSHLNPYVVGNTGSVILKTETDNPIYAHGIYSALNRAVIKGTVTSLAKNIKIEKDGEEIDPSSLI
ncbi:hypothetical protein KA005_73110 [bacterium]|nr:hypothetical protein [bacterium]